MMDLRTENFQGNCPLFRLCENTHTAVVLLPPPLPWHDGHVLQGTKHIPSGYLEEGDDVLGFGVQHQLCTLSGSG